MKRTIALMMTLMFAVLCCVGAQAEAKDEIRFEGIAWGSDLETVKQAMLDAGWINEGGVERFGMIEERIARVKEGKQGAGTRYPQFVHHPSHSLSATTAAWPSKNLSLQSTSPEIYRFC